MRVIAVSIAAAFALLCAKGFGAEPVVTAPPTAQCTAAMKNATIDDASRVGEPQSNEQTPTVSLGDTIVIKVAGLTELQRDCTRAPIVLYLNGYPIKSLKEFPPSAPAADGPGALNFVLAVTDSARASWTPILGRPCCEAKDIEVSVGVENEYPLPPTAGKRLPKFKLDVLGNRWFVIWVIVFAVMVGIFAWCVGCTNILRNGNPRVWAGGRGGTFSLSKCQGAFWFFIILAAYLLIGIVTGDYSINSTAVILLGIGAGTVVGSAVIDASQQQDIGQTEAATKLAEGKLNQLEQEVAATDAELKSSPPPSPAVEERLAKERIEKAKERNFALSQYRKLTGQSENIVTDILSDADGVSFHRFQMAAWTIVLGIVFVKGVYENLAMPIFDPSLMGLLGLSAGTYLGLKIPEAKTPTL